MILAVEGLTKRFGGVTAVADVSFTIAEGSITALLGPNGAGKTTVFAMIAGFVKPDGGRVVFAGRPITGLPPFRICRLGVARTFQLVKPFAGLSVRENIAVGAHLHEQGRARALEAASEIGRRLGMGAMLDQQAGRLTVAGRKRLELARALATGPRLLLLDEVMAGLTPPEILEIAPILQDIRASGVTILLIEHVMQAVMRLAEQIFVLNQGRLIAQGPPQLLVQDEAVVEAYLGPGAAARLRLDA